MIVQIAAKEFDISGFMVVNTLPDNSLVPVLRRVNRAATLDGGVAINDGGFSHGDREMTLTYLTVSDEHDDTARRLLELHSRVYVSTHEGLFEASPVSFESSSGRNTFTLYLISRVDED